MIVEIKAVTELADVHRAQVHNYLKATDEHLGLLRESRMELDRENEDS